MHLCPVLVSCTTNVSCILYSALCMGDSESTINRSSTHPLKGQRAKAKNARGHMGLSCGVAMWGPHMGHPCGVAMWRFLGEERGERGEPVMKFAGLVHVATALLVHGAAAKSNRWRTRGPFPGRFVQV
eukprot:COSAG02_NODE_953_length_15689_cov_112.180564_13_plen_128_part_00